MKHNKKPSVPKFKRTYDAVEKAVIYTEIPDLNGIKEYKYPVPNAMPKTSVCKYCSKNLVRGYICRDCRELENPTIPVKDTAGIKEGLVLLAEIRANESMQRQEDMEENATISIPKKEITYDTCGFCGMSISLDDKLYTMLVNVKKRKHKKRIAVCYDCKF
jgi:hypothetical protein